MLASALQKSGCSANPRAFEASGQTQHWHRAGPVCCAGARPHPEQRWRPWGDLASRAHWESLQVLQSHGHYKTITQTVLNAGLCRKSSWNQKIERRTKIDVFWYDYWITCDIVLACYCKFIVFRGSPYVFIVTCTWYVCIYWFTQFNYFLSYAVKHVRLLCDTGLNRRTSALTLNESAVMLRR